MTRKADRGRYLSFPPAKEFVTLVTPKMEHAAANGHTALDGVLDVAISESLQNLDALKQLERWNFLQKVELVIALGVIPPESRPAYDALNNARNLVAHNLGAQLDREKLLSSLTAQQRYSPTDEQIRESRLSSAGVALFVVWSLYEELRSAIERRREMRLRAEARADIDREARATANYGNAWALAQEAEETEIAKRVAAKKEECGYTYESPKHGPPWSTE